MASQATSSPILLLPFAPSMRFRLLNHQATTPFTHTLTCLRSPPSLPYRQGTSRWRGERRQSAASTKAKALRRLPSSSAPSGKVCLPKFLTLTYSKDELMSNKVLLLYSSLTSDAVQEQDQRRAHSLLTAKGIEFVEIDGADPKHLEKRNELFRLGRKAQYPQIYIQRADGKITYVGGWEEVEAMNECCDMPKEVLRANPQIQTFDQVFVHVQRTKRSSLGLPPAASSYS